MAVIKSGATTDQLTIGPTSKAAYVTPYNGDGVDQSPKKTYRASNAAIATANGTGIFLALVGSASKTISITKIIVSGPTLTAVAIVGCTVSKYSTAPTGGTATTLTQVPLDANNAAGTAALCVAYTVAPTAGTLVGVIDSKRRLMQAAVAAAGAPLTDYEFYFGDNKKDENIVLRGVNQAIGVSWAAAPGSATTVAVMIEWTEE